ncbi:MAG TPA: hypothetical protein VJT73_16740 [Polyangiaceae bacterium]|nr:hypothetical protein [Polyangiaceae bacterium]
MKPRAPTAVSFTEFCRVVLRHGLTVGQRVFAKVAFDGVDPCELVGRERRIADEIFGGAETIPPAARRVIVAYFGRDSGKTTLAADYVVYRLLTSDLSACGPGDIPIGVVIAPDTKTARVMIRMALARVKASPELASLVKGETATSFTLRRPTDKRLVAFEAIAASRGGAAARGRTIVVGALDEAEFLYSGDGYVRTDGESFRAMTPRLVKGGAIMLISTPWGDESLMRKLHAENFGDPKTALVAKAPTLVMRDDDPELAARIDAEMASDPDNAKREFFCNLAGLGGSARLFDPQTIDNAVDPDADIVAVHDSRGAGRNLVPVFDRAGAAWDLGLVRDCAVQVVVGRRRGVYQVASLREHRPQKGAPLKLSHIVTTFADDLEAFPRIRRVVADGHAREPAREYASKRGIAIDHAPEGAAGKALVYLLAKKLFAEGRVIIPNNPRLISQLKSITIKQAPGGGLTISAPRRGGSHGDICSALVLALWQCDRSAVFAFRGSAGKPDPTSARYQLATDAERASIDDLQVSATGQSVELRRNNGTGVAARSGGF